MSSFLFLLMMTSAMAMPFDRRTIKSTVSIERCESGRVCMDTCYYNGERIDCVERTTLKSVLFNPSFGKILPSVHLRLIEIDANEQMFNSDVIIKKENLTSNGMNIRLSVSIDSTMQYICAEWLACSSNTH